MVLSGLGRGMGPGHHEHRVQRSQGRDCGWRVGEDDLIAHHLQKDNGSKEEVCEHQNIRLR